MQRTYTRNDSQSEFKNKGTQNKIKFCLNTKVNKTKEQILRKYKGKQNKRADTAQPFPAFFLLTVVVV